VFDGWKTDHAGPTSRSLRAWQHDGNETGEIWKCLIRNGLVERATGIGPVSEAWEASVLPLYEARLNRFGAD
jgi:hypothetical protein